MHNGHFRTPRIDTRLHSSMQLKQKEWRQDTNVVGRIYVEFRQIGHDAVDFNVSISHYSCSGNKSVCVLSLTTTESNRRSHCAKRGAFFFCLKIHINFTYHYRYCRYLFRIAFVVFNLFFFFIFHFYLQRERVSFLATRRSNTY